MSRWVHWGVFACLLVIYACGGVIFLRGVKESLNFVHWHQPFGAIVLLLTLWRLSVWVRVKKGESGKGILAFLRSFNVPAYVQFALILCCLLMPVLGILMCATGGYSVHLGLMNIPSFLPKSETASSFFRLGHNALAVVLLGLIFLHIAGAIRSYLAMRALKKKLSAMSFDF